MKTALLGLAAPVAAIAAFTLSAAPAAAQGFTSAGFASSGVGTSGPLESLVGVPPHRPGFNDGHGGHHDGDHHHGHDGRLGSSVFVDWYGGEWAYYNNRSWDPDSYNDWWHDNPDRAYPAWMRRNRNCERQWYSGDTLVC